MKEVKISYDLFAKLVLYHLGDIEDYWKYEDEIKKGLEIKFEAALKRDYYTKYKTAPTDEQKEKYRTLYLDAVGMHKNFRY